MPDLEPYQYLIILGRVYQMGLFLYALYLLTRRRLWLLQVVFVVGAAAYAAHTVLAGLGLTAPVTLHRLLAIYGNAVCFHVLLLVIHTMIRSQSLGQLKPFGSDHAP